LTDCAAVTAAERDYDLQFWKEELIREINELEKSAAELAVSARFSFVPAHGRM